MADEPFVNLPVATSVGTSDSIAIVQSGTVKQATVDQFMANAPRATGATGPAGPQGNPGGNVMSVGVFTSLGSLTIPSATNVIRTSGYSTDGDGGDAWYLRAGSVSPGLPSSVAKQDAAGIWWKYLINGPFQIEQFGGKGDWNGTTGTLNDTPLSDIMSLITYSPETGHAEAIFGREIVFGVGRYRFAGSVDSAGNNVGINLKKVVHIRGQGGGAGTDSHGAATILSFPADTAGIIVNLDTTNGTGNKTSSTTTAAGSIIEGLELASDGGINTSCHGLQLRGAATIRDVTIDGPAYYVGQTPGPFPGDGVHIVAYVGTTDSTYGNASGFYLEKVYVKSTGQKGFNIDGSDSNAGNTIGCRVKSAPYTAFYDNSSFGNVHNGLEIDGYGTSGAGVVSYNGATYILISPTAGVGASTTPGTNDKVWYYLTNSAGGHPAWSGTGSYTMGLPIYIGGDSVVIGPYVEGSLTSTPSHAGPQAKVILTVGVNSARGWWTVYSPTLNSAGTVWTTATGFRVNYAAGISNAGAKNWIADLGNSTQQYQWLGFQHDADGNQPWSLKGDGGGNVQWSTGSSYILRMTSSVAGPTDTYGRGYPVPNAVNMRILAVPSDLSSTDGRLVNYGNAAPTTGSRAVGEIKFSTTVSPTAPWGWVITTAGATATGAWAGNTLYAPGSCVTNDSGKTYLAVLAPTWAASTVYAAGACVTNGTTGVQYKTTAGGTSGSTAPTGTNSGGQFISDGGITDWASFAFGTSASSGGPTGTGTAILDGTVTWKYQSTAFVSTPTYLYPRASPTTGIGYVSGAGGTVTQLTSRTTGVTINNVCGQITLVSAAGTATWQSFTVTNSAVAATDVIRVVQASGTDKNMIHVTAVGSGTFEITFATTGGTTTEQPVFNFAVIKAVAA